MDNKMVFIEEAGAPNVLVNGIKFELLCELEAKDGTFQRVFIKEGGSDVVVELSEKSAVAGFFSIEENKLRQLFDYIESTISPNGSLICYASEDFPRFLNLAENAGGRYLTIQSVLYPKKRTFLTGILQHLRPQHFLDKVLQNQIQKHMLPVEHISHSVSEIDFEALQERELTSRVFPVESLPKGWEWKEYDDGSGSLNSPAGKSYFSYDRISYIFAGGIEYKETSDDSWGVFWGSMSDFKVYAESVVNEKYLDAKAISYNNGSLSEQIQTASILAAESQATEKVPVKELPPAR